MEKRQRNRDLSLYSVQSPSDDQPPPPFQPHLRTRTRGPWGTNPLTRVRAPAPATRPAPTDGWPPPPAIPDPGRRRSRSGMGKGEGPRTRESGSDWRILRRGSCGP